MELVCAHGHRRPLLPASLCHSAENIEIVEGGTHDYKVFASPEDYTVFLCPAADAELGAASVIPLGPAADAEAGMAAVSPLGPAADAELGAASVIPLGPAANAEAGMAAVSDAFVENKEQHAKALAACVLLLLCR